MPELKRVKRAAVHAAMKSKAISIAFPNRKLSLSNQNQNQNHIQIQPQNEIQIPGLLKRVEGVRIRELAMRFRCLKLPRPALAFLWREGARNESWSNGFEL